MRRSARLSEKYAYLENEAHVEPNAKKNRRDNKITTIATMDNGTMVEAFKFLNYCQLAINSLVSKRYRDLIRTHRHALALLYVDQITMNAFFSIFPSVIKIFDTELSPEAYNKWIVRNNYSNAAPLKHQYANTQHTQNIFDDYQLVSYAHYKDPKHREAQDRTTVLFSRVKFNDETLPVLKHFVRLLTDPFIYILYVELTQQTDFFNLLAATTDRSNFGRLQCETLAFDFEEKSLNLFNWIKDHVRCEKFILEVSNRDKPLLDFFVTGSVCASEIVVTPVLYKAIVVGFVQKFMDLKCCDESHIVYSIQGTVIKPTGEALKSIYAKFFIKEEEERYGLTTHVFEIVNADIGKKMQLSIIGSNQVTLEIINL